MTANPNVLDDVRSLSDAGDGVILVTVQYNFRPGFAGFAIGQMEMQEKAFTRGRKSSVVNRV
jgi:hypothetical protein